MIISPKVSFWLLLLLLVIPGIAGVCVFGYYSLIDWAALQSAYLHFEQIAAKQLTFQSVFIAESQQNIHRVNLFADGVWALLSAVLAAIGLHGLCQRRIAG